ncbi:MAG TPA: PE-PPE domain-containing protein [Mycobacterium sp.]|nr:PE-PPE domain-containing protein [Mycobacterium sp.]
MTGGRFRWLSVGLVASGGAGLLALTAIMHSAFAYGAPATVSPPLPPPVPDTTLVMGPSGVPIPDTSYIDAVNSLYIQPNLPGSTPAVVFTPEGLYPITGVKSLPLDPSVAQGVTILDDTLQPYVQAGIPVGVSGYSQSAIISSLEMQQLDPTGTPSDIPLRFVLMGDEMNPNGGALERFAGLQLPSLGLNFYGATPADDFPTTMYTAEYDGFADFPRYPINVLSDLNAVLGIVFVHPNYAKFTAGQVTPVADGGQAIPLPTEGPTDTSYYVIPTENLPLLDPLRAIPIVGKPLADLLQPDLTALVNLGYGDPDFGYSTAPANVPTPFGLFPSASDFDKLPGLLATGTQQGIQHFIDDLSNPSSLIDPGSTDLLAAFSDTASSSATPLSSFTDFVNSLSAAASSLYSSLLPTADIANALVTSLPAYATSLFLDNLSEPLQAIGLPTAATLGLVTLAGGVEFLVLASAVAQALADVGL